MTRAFVYHDTWQVKYFLIVILCYIISPPICRWYHNSLTMREAETLLLSKGQDGSFLVRASGFYMLSVRVDERVSHIIIRDINRLFDTGSGPKFDTLIQLVEYYKKNPLVETSGSVIYLKHPFHSTSFFPDIIFKRVSELQKQNSDVYGKTGFWEEFEVCSE